MGAIKATIVRFMQEKMTDRAAGLTYYSLLSLFPGLLVLVAAVGVFGRYPETTDKILQVVGQLGPSSAVETFRRPIEEIVRNKGGAGALLGIGLLGALWAASGYVAGFMRASNEIYEVPRERRIFRQLPVRVGLTIVMLVLLFAVALGLVITGPLAEATGEAIGLESTVVSLWSVVKWPVLVLLTGVAFAVLYFCAPNVRHRSFSALLPGAILAVVVWLLGSVAFAVYLANFGSYNKTYGTLGGVIVLLLWLFISNNALLVGALFNSERERARQGKNLDQPLTIELRDPKGKEAAYTHRGYEAR